MQGYHEIYISTDDNQVAEADVVWTLVATGAFACLGFGYAQAARERASTDGPLKSAVTFQSLQHPQRSPVNQWRIACRCGKHFLTALMFANGYRKLGE